MAKNKRVKKTVKQKITKAFHKRETLLNILGAYRRHMQALTCDIDSARVNQNTKLLSDTILLYQEFERRKFKVKKDLNAVNIKLDLAPGDESEKRLNDLLPL